MTKTQKTILGSGVVLLALFWLTRLVGIAIFPPFVDETIHIFTAEKLSQISPLYNSDLARQFTVWWYWVFYPTGSANPLWVARIATLLVVIVGFASAIATGKLAYGKWGAIFTGLFYLFSNYHFFFERLALADSVSSAVIMLAIYFAFRLKYRTHLMDALACGLALFVAFGAKTNALPYFALPVLAGIFLWQRGRNLKDHLRWVALALGVGLGLSALLVIGLRFFGYDYLLSSLAFAINGQWEADASEVGGLLDGAKIVTNVLLRANMLIAYSGLAFLVGSLTAIVWALVRRQLFLLACFGLPASVFLLSGVQESRYWISALATVMILNAIFLAWFIERYPMAKWAVWGAIGIWAIWVSGPFMWTALTQAIALQLDAKDRNQYINSDAAGFGLDEVIVNLQQVQAQRVVGALSNCQGFRYRAWHIWQVECLQIRPEGEDRQAIFDFAQANRLEGVYMVLEDTPYAPETIDGRKIVTIQRPANRANLTIYDLSPTP